jgi:hypothetical protein
MTNSTAIKVGILFGVAAVFVGGVILFSNAVSRNETRHDDFGYAGSEDRRIEKSFQVQPDGELILTTDLGDVQIEGWERTEVSVLVEKRGDEKRSRRFDVSFDQSANKIEIRGKYEGKWQFWNWDNFNVRFTIKVPTKYRVRVNTSGGDVALGNVDGTIRCETSGGDIKVHHVNGDLWVETSGGDVNISDVAGNVDASTSGGDVTLLKIDGRINAETSGGDIEARVTGDNRGIRLDTSGGDITIYVPDNISADIDASTSGGEVKMRVGGNFSGRVEDTEVHGRLNGGGNMIKAETSGGDVRIYSASRRNGE